MSDALAPRTGIKLAENQKIAWLRLIRSENVGPATFMELIKRYGTASNALDALPELTARGRGKKINISTQDEAEREYQQIQDFGGAVVCIGEPEYPIALRAGDAPPPVIAVKGSTAILNRNTIAFVGSRNASIAGIKLTQSLARDVSAAGFATVSGLARGIDSAAHSATLSGGTIAVFAGGIDHIYPYENKELAAQIIESGGASISELPFGWKPRAQDFPRRNRIVAGMALGLVVVEAAKRSGSLISARLANEIGRLVFAVPGSPLDPRSEGANHLIKQGAQLITSAEDIIHAIEPLTDSSHQSSYSLEESVDDEVNEEPSNSDRDIVMNAIGHTPTEVDDLIRFTDLSPGKVQLILLELDLAGQIERHSGNRVSLT